MASISHNALLLLLFIHRLISISTVGLTLPLSPSASDRLSRLTSDTHSTAIDFGATTSSFPLAVLHPESATDIIALISKARFSSPPLPVSARGHGHSINGQAGARGGLVVAMSGGRRRRIRIARPRPENSAGRQWVDVWGGELWIDVLNWTLANSGLAPRSWTDYLYLSVGGTLSNAGISGQAFHYGPQTSNVYELDVVTGKGELVTCSEKKNSELFYAVLGGLGQFGIITRARIALERAPQRVRWIRVLYSDFGSFTRDQEHLISLYGRQRFDYVEGFVIVDEGLINNWRTSFFSTSNPVKISMIGKGNHILYCLELAKNYDQTNVEVIDEEVETLLRELNFIPASVFTTDLSYVDFLDRVHKAELKLRDKGLWDVPHPWLNLFVPASKINDFDRGVFRGILGNKTGGPILIYPIKKQRLDERSSVVTPDEDIFYLVAFLRSAVPGSGDQTQSLAYLIDQNRQILEYCESAGIGAKQYLPNHSSRAKWEDHFGPGRWERFFHQKAEFDPNCILGIGQGIFHPDSCPFSSSSFPS
ncbi:Cytokinin dehydrogenase 5 [Platanthera zijinensis]|uniref:cytokinin dehydrogenase n=1 Tax=Platanthera zijinensis TaxID=2320716 RepID=A0AAP0G824_9ASPA